jgi:hypothetical protein
MCYAVISYSVFSWTQYNTYMVRNPFLISSLYLILFVQIIGTPSCNICLLKFASFSVVEMFTLMSCFEKIAPLFYIALLLVKKIA